MSNKPKSKLLGNLKKGFLVVMSAPAGTGKTTLMNMLKEEFSCVLPSISYTSRKPRAGEVDGQHYHFISEEEFEEKIASGDFLEHVRLYGDYYGTEKEWVVAQQEKGKHVFLVIDTQGAKLLKGKVEALFIFISPPSLEELGQRLRDRKTETPEVVEKRLAWAAHEMEAIPEYDYNICNDDLDVAYQTLRSILIAEEHRVRKKEKEKE